MYRRSRQKETIIKVLRSTEAHPDAEWIYEQVRKEIPNISLGTIYRNLKLLRESGVIHDVRFSGRSEHFDGKIAPHYHFRCDTCGKIFDLAEKIDRGLEARVAHSTGFKVTRHNLEFGGLCLECNKS